MLTLQVDIYLVEKAEDIEPSLCALRASMKDEAIGIDMEWKPDWVARTPDRPTGNKVAMIQLASSSVVVLIRTCKLGGSLPTPVIKFCG